MKINLTAHQEANNFRVTAKREGFKIETRQQENNGVKGIRIWVTAKPDA
mgnify:CR=1 FL=1